MAREATAGSIFDDDHPESKDDPYLRSKRSGAQEDVRSACDDVTASVKDRRENGGTHRNIRVRALSLIRLVVADLNA